MLLTSRLLSGLLASGFVAFASSHWTGPTAPPAPTATLSNGTYQGVHSIYYDQDWFLGMPFAQPPVGELRLAPPAPLNTSFDGIRLATAYGPVCPSYGSDDIGLPLSEDCLSINVIRPAGYEHAALPVAVWIYGGEYAMGGGSNPKYNLSFIVQDSVAAGLPIIGVSFNYRVGAFGFLSSAEVTAAGVANLGLRDQRLALHWVQENIARFGGDAAKVTLWGESAGADSIGHQMRAYGGRDDGLFRGAIAESGGPLMFQGNSAAENEAVYQSVLNGTGCANATDGLACLRSVPYITFLNVTTGTGALFSTVVDGDFLRNLSSVALSAGNFTKVPLLIGSNTGEGTAFAPSGINNDSALMAYLTGSSIRLDNETARDMMLLYPDIPAYGTPPSFIGRPNSTYGTQFHRAAAIAGDFTIHRGRRFSAEIWSRYNVTVYTYRFNVWPLTGVSNLIGISHYKEIEFVFDNEKGDGFFPPYGTTSELVGQPDTYKTISRLISGMWISFINDLHPNNHPLVTYAAGGPVPEWPVYAPDATLALEGYGQNFVFDTNLTGLATIEQDTWRGPGIAYCNSPSVQLQLGT
ncbi:hypothetical protein A1O1_07016 [Capronia coronata CBS 617.96]|uniref:Carboxylic ester hydrolase n=1 Tax=Capronia coronata CBS 617.96 TaxID=1182541 RepID=W9YMB3_9EURO|nr:uncharacterized protein A1O1_07016 [Capronia coronata CBS 617.96]EXJ83394.1 hypothetical protein A1O1_07016 [Capronia coronata CBS 617.96]